MQIVNVRWHRLRSAMMQVRERIGHLRAASIIALGIAAITRPLGAQRRPLYRLTRPEPVSLGRGCRRNGRKVLKIVTLLILAGLLTPIRELSGAFLRPESPPI